MADYVHAYRVLAEFPAGTEGHDEHEAHYFSENRQNDANALVRSLVAAGATYTFVDSVFVESSEVTNS